MPKNYVSYSSLMGSTPTPSYSSGGGGVGRSFKSYSSMLSGGVTPPEENKNKIFSGGFVQDIGDALSVGQYALAGGVHGMIEGNGFLKGAGEGIQNRASWTDILKEHTGLKDNPKAAAVLGTVLDIVADPLNFIPAGKVAGAIGKGAMKASDLTGVTKALRSIPVHPEFAKWLTKEASDYVVEGKNLGEVLDRIAQDKPLLAKLEKLNDARIMDTARMMEEPTMITQGMRKYNAKVRGLMTDYIETPDNMRRAEILDAVKAEGVNPQEFTSLAERAGKVNMTLGEALNKMGALGDEALQKYGGGKNWLHKEYEMFADPANYIKKVAQKNPEKAKLLEQELKAKGFNITAKGLKTTSQEAGTLMMRKEFAPAVEKEMGLIKDAPYRFMKGAALESNLIAKNRFYQNVADEFAKTFDSDLEAVGRGFAKMPEGKEWGALSGKWVPEVVYNYLNQPVRNPSDAAKFLKKWVYSPWKMGKTILNPATHARNTISNFILADWGAGLTPGSPRWWKYVTQAAKELTGKGDLYQEAKGAGTFLVDTFAGNEIPKILRETGDLNPNKFTGLIGSLAKAGKKVGEKAGDLYEFEEQLGKMTTYLAKRDELIKGGMDAATAAKTAADEAEKWLFNYRKVPRWLERLRNPDTIPGMILSNPFITFTYKAAPRVAETLLTHPERISKYYKFGHGIEAMSDPGETGAERKVLPDWMKKGIWVKLPTKDKYGRSLYLDATYLFPLADIQGSSVTGPGQKPPFMNMPFVTLMTDLMRNQSQFSGKPIWDEGDDKLTAGKKFADYLTSFFLPSLAPGGYGFKGIRDAAVGKPDWLGRTRSLGAALGAYIAGFKTRPIDYNEELGWRMKEIEDQLNNTQFQMKKAMANPAISEKEKEHIWNMGMERINDLLGQMDDMVS